MRLNLGCADRALQGWVNVDIAPAPWIDQVADLTQTWPWQDASVSEVFAADVFEHLPDRIHTMNELWRVLRPGATAKIEVPSAARGAGFAQDPTHKSMWCMNSFQYFEHGSFARNRLAKLYGIKAAFRVRGLSERVYRDVHEDVYKITAILEAVK